jgi:hypothetical protein
MPKLGAMMPMLVGIFSLFEKKFRMLVILGVKKFDKKISFILSI